MEQLVENHGLSWIALQIFDELDDESLANARLINTSWRCLIDDALLEKRKHLRERRLVREKWECLKKSRHTSYLFRQWPEWKNIFDDFQERRNLEDTKKLCQIITKYFGSYLHISTLYDPLMVAAVLHNDISVFELVLPSVKSLRFADKNGRTVLHKATTYARLEIIELILTKYPHLIDFWQRDHHVGSRELGRTVLDEAVLQRMFKNTEERIDILSLYQKFAESIEN